MDQDGTWYGGRPQPSRLCVRWGPSPYPKQGAESPPQFSVRFYSGQTDGCIKMPLGMEASLSPGDFVLDGTHPPHPRQGGPLPFFGPCLLWPKGWINQDGSYHGGGPWYRPHSPRWEPRFPPPKKGGTWAEPMCFLPIFIVAKRLDASRYHLVWRYASA